MRRSLKIHRPTSQIASVKSIPRIKVSLTWALMIQHSVGRELTNLMSTTTTRLGGSKDAKPVWRGRILNNRLAAECRRAPKYSRILTSTVSPARCSNHLLPSREKANYYQVTTAALAALSKRVVYDTHSLEASRRGMECTEFCSVGIIDCTNLILGPSCAQT